MGVIVAEGVMDGVAVNKEVAVGGMVEGGVKVMNGAEAFNRDNTYKAVSFLGSKANAFERSGRTCLA